MRLQDNAGCISNGKIHVIHRLQYMLFNVVDILIQSGFEYRCQNVTWTSREIKSDRDYGTAHRHNR